LRALPVNAIASGTAKDWRIKQFQEKWDPVFRPELRQEIGC
jgi:hypothetical protein